MIEYFEGPSCHKHDHGHIPPMESVKFTVAQYYTSLLSQFMRHKNNQRIHVSEEDRERWDNKSDSISLDELEQELLNQIDALRNDIPTKVSQLTNDLGFITASDLDDYGFITTKTIGQYIKNNVGITREDLSNALRYYYTSEYIDNTFVRKGENDGIDESKVNSLIRSYMTSAILWYKNDTNNPVRLGDTVEISGGQGATYTAGDGITINNNVISLKKASSTTLGGIRTNYATNGKNYAVKINSTGDAYVNVPWEAREGGTSYKTELWFRNVNTGVTPSAPTTLSDLTSQGWSRENINITSSQDTWGVVVYYQDGILTQIASPFPLSTSGGSNGEDGNSIEFIYKRFSEIANADTLDDWMQELNRDAHNDQERNVPNGWTDHPSGIDPEEYRYEYMSYRLSAIVDGNRTWGPTWSQPVIWSAWGQDGMDGDGVEYIFYAVDGNSQPPSGNEDPRGWINLFPDTFQNREFIPSSSNWQDNPIDLQEAGYQQGSKEWVSIRKKYKDDGATEATWHSYSEPALWAYYAIDGVVDGYTVDVINEMMAVGTSSSGSVTQFSDIAQVQVYHNNDAILHESDPSRSSGSMYFTITNQNPVVSDGRSLSSNNYSCNIDLDEIQITLSGISNAAGVNIRTPLVVNIYDSSNILVASRKVSTTVVCVPGGGDGGSWKLNPSANIIHSNYSRTNMVPATVDVECLVAIGQLADVRRFYPLNPDTNFTFRYAITTESNSSITYRSFNSNQITVPNKATNIYIQLLYNYNGTQYIIDEETIPVVADGAPGIAGVSAVNYQINILENTVECWQNTDAGGYYKQGSVSFSVYKTEGGNAPVEIVDQSDEIVYADMDGNTAVDYQNNPDCWRIYTTRPQPVNQFKYTLIQVKSQTGTILASAVVPFILRGEKGDPGDSTVQSLDGTVMSFHVYSSDQHYYDGTEYASDGIRYLDIVYDDNTGSYYRLDPDRGPNSNARNTRPAAADGTVNEGWLLFNAMDNAAFQALIAENGFINNLTARELVITDNNNNPVAGMTRGTAVKGDGDALNGVTRGNVRIWAGNPVSNGVANLTNCPFYVTDEGYLKATKANIIGVIYARDGYFSGEVNIGSGKIVLNSDGSGHIANGSISWDINGNVVIKGAVIKGSTIEEDDIDWVSVYNNIEATGIQFYDKTSNYISAQVYITNHSEYDIEGAEVRVFVDGQNMNWEMPVPGMNQFQVSKNGTVVVDVPQMSIEGYNTSASVDTTTVQVQIVLPISSTTDSRYRIKTFNANDLNIN